jgi:hypothetical protein
LHKQNKTKINEPKLTKINMPTKKNAENRTELAQPRIANAYEFNDGLPFHLLKPTSVGLEYACFFCTQKKFDGQRHIIGFARRTREGIEAGVTNVSNILVYQRQNGICVYAILSPSIRIIKEGSRGYAHLNSQLPPAV